MRDGIQQAMNYYSWLKQVENKNVLPITNFNYKKSVFDQSLNLQNLTTFYKKNTTGGESRSLMVKGYNPSVV